LSRGYTAPLIASSHASRGWTWDPRFAPLDGSRQAAQLRQRDAQRDLDLAGHASEETTAFADLESDVVGRDEAFPETADLAEQRIQPFLDCSGSSRDLLRRSRSLFALGLGGYLLSASAIWVASTAQASLRPDRRRVAASTAFSSFAIALSLLMSDSSKNFC
jgi:hypothetical protein